MERKIMADLQKWKDNNAKKPLIIQGARQVGKTHTALTFGKIHYKNVAYFDMEFSGAAAKVFERDLNPERVIKELEVVGGQSIIEGDTLIIFDEIQACERALTSLKYFAESELNHHIIAAGSLLGVALRRERFSFPVGKVDMLSVHPLDFEEFLLATDNAKLRDLIRESFERDTPLAAHEMAMDLYKTYLVVGGMPAAVREYIEKRDFNFVNAELKSLNDSYIADMAKYTTPHEMTRVMAAWASVPAQLSKENHKFQYKVIKSGARASDYETAMDWLTGAGIIHKCVNVTQGKMPLSAYAENNTFKVYMSDTGLLCSKFDIAANTVIHTPTSFDGFKGALTENYICQALIANGIAPYYWSSNGRAEVDFVFQNRQGEILPLEAKSAENVRSRSLRSYVEAYKPPFSYRVSAKNFGFENGIKSVPLYAMFCVGR